jgi:hypothetical protein
MQAGARGGPGDPGLFSFIGKIAKKAVSFIPGVGPIISTALDLIPGLGSKRPAPTLAPLPLLGPDRQIGPPRAAGAAAITVEPGIGCPKGYHANKSSYYLMDGSFVEKGTRCVKNRRRNPMNARALSRAISRVDGGKRFQHTLSEIETGKFTKAGNRKAHTHN